ncbi:hypothetical protein [Bradyrhizobium sp. SZCCHNS2015]|uniref:hypothetical protein n=1 Tax=Bradyrhizobium sp. SZCCHNS2015 TaxID=3057305 RepID=UPI0028F0E397|nr:hypothetical protein [Bradyrhizobium sp. SZCCHNS2015]
MQPLAEVADYEDLVRALRDRADQLAISRETIDALAGFPDRYAVKILTLSTPKPVSADRTRDSRGSVRRIGMTSLGPLLGALSLKLLVVEDLEALERNRSRYAERSHAHTVSAKARWEGSEGRFRA